MVMKLLLTSASVLGVTIATRIDCGHWNHTLGFGYNIVIGDPLRGVIGQGPPEYQDPGFPGLGQIIYTDGVQPDNEVTCSSSASSATIDSTSSLQSSMRDTAKTSVGIPLIFSFSASTSYKTAKKEMESSKSVFVKSSVQCGVQEASLKFARLDAGGGDAYKLSPHFIQAVKDLPTDLHDTHFEYYEFLHNFGTHFVQNVVMGASYTEISTFSASDLTTSFSSQDGVNIAASGTLEDTLKLGAGGGHMSKETKQFASSSQYASAKKLLMGGPIMPSSPFEDWVSISQKCPTPLEYTLMETFRLFHSKNFPNDDYIEIKKNLLKNALMSYCKVYILGHLGKDCALDAYDVEMNYYKSQVNSAVQQASALANQLVQLECDNGNIPISCAWKPDVNPGGKQPPAFFMQLVYVNGGLACQCLANPWVGGTCYAVCVNKQVVHDVHLIGHMPSTYTESTVHNTVVHDFNNVVNYVEHESRSQHDSGEYQVERITKPPGRRIQCCPEGYTAIGCMGQIPATFTWNGDLSDTYPNRAFPDYYVAEPAQGNGKSCCQFGIEDGYSGPMFGQAVCASNIDNYKIVQSQGTGNVIVTCPADTYLLTCGYHAIDTRKGAERTSPGYAPVGKDLLKGTCSCYNYFGVICYAACGAFQVEKSKSASRLLYDISESGPVEGEETPKAKVLAEDGTDAEAAGAPVAMGSDAAVTSVSPISTTPAMLSILAVGGVAVGAVM